MNNRNCNCNGRCNCGWNSFSDALTGFLFLLGIVFLIIHPLLLILLLLGLLAAALLYGLLRLIGVILGALLAPVRTFRQLRTAWQLSGRRHAANALRAYLQLAAIMIGLTLLLGLMQIPFVAPIFVLTIIGTAITAIIRYPGAHR